MSRSLKMFRAQPLIRNPPFFWFLVFFKVNSCCTKLLKQPKRVHLFAGSKTGGGVRQGSRAGRKAPNHVPFPSLEGLGFPWHASPDSFAVGSPGDVTSLPSLPPRRANVSAP